MRYAGLIVGPLCALLSVSSLAFDEGSFSGAPDFSSSIATLARRIPAGSGPLAHTGSQFVARILGLDSRQREAAIRHEILAGDLPEFLRNLVPVNLSFQPSDGSPLNAIVFVMPEYLAIGSDADFLRIPMNLYTAAAVASRFGFTLPTRRIVDAIDRQAAFHLAPEPMTPSPEMRSTEYYRLHNEKIETQSRALGVTPGALVSGDKKDVVITNLLATHPGRIAIYGWRRLSGDPIQPLSTVHGACYADYSHGIRLVSETMLVNGRRRSIYDVLADPRLAGLVSDEGPIRNLRDRMKRLAGEMPCGEQPPAAH